MVGKSCSGCLILLFLIGCQTIYSVPASNQPIVSDPLINSSCGDIFCFYANFKSCSVSSVTHFISGESVSYSIVGPVSGGCLMKTATSSESKSCVYDNSLPFSVALQSPVC